MARAYDIVVLSSSPPPAAAPLSPLSPFDQHERVVQPLSSPLQLSPIASPKRPSVGALKSGSRAAAIPVDASRGFATARSLISNVDDNLAQLRRRKSTEAQKELVAIKNPRKRPTKITDAATADNGIAKKPRKSPAQITEADKVVEPIGRTTRKAKPAPATTSSHFATTAAIDTTEPPCGVSVSAAQPKPTSAKSRKPRAKKLASEDSEIPIIQETKVPRSRGSTTGQGRRKATGNASTRVGKLQKSHVVPSESIALDGTTDRNDHTSGGKVQAIWDVPLSPFSTKNGPPKQSPDNENWPLALDEAVTRRRDWTPPKDTNPFTDASTHPTTTEDEPTVDGLGKGSFTSLLSGYTYAHMGPISDKTTATTQNSNPEIINRQRDNLVDVPGVQISRQPSPEKAKAPKKKPRTITDLVTGQYASLVLDTDPANITSEFFAPRLITATAKIPLNDSTKSDANKLPKKNPRRRPTSKSVSDNGELKPKPKKVVKASSKAAAKPKLVAEKLLSPSSAVLRLSRQDVLFGTSSQLALEESPTMVRQIQRALEESEQDVELLPWSAAEKRPNTVPWPQLGGVKGTRKLWAASARDDDGELLENRNDVYMPEPDRAQDFPLLMDGANDKSDSSFVDIDDFDAPPRPATPPAPIILSSDLPTPPPTMSGGAIGKAQEAQELEDKHSSFLDIDDFPQAPPPSNQNVQSSFLNIDDFIPSAQPPADPRPPPANVSTGLPKQPRGRPPKHPNATLQRAATNVPTLKKPPPKLEHASTAPPATPRKEKKRSFTGIEEILDSEDDEALSPTPPRTRGLKEMPPLPFTSNASSEKDNVVPILRVPETQLVFANVKDALFARITSTIRSLPPTTNPFYPSWHEKILMYDALVLEEFTAFLNTHPTLRTYKRATQKQVKAWNKELKGKGEQAMKIDVSGTDMLAVFKELEIWMVQKWCEEMSICCVAKEGRGKGGVRKGLY